MAHDCPDIVEWPCTYEGSEEFFGLDLSEYLKAEGDTFVSIEWTLPNGLSSLAEVVINNIAYIKIQANYAGMHIVRFKLRSVESGSTQTYLGKSLLHVQEY